MTLFARMVGVLALLASLIGTAVMALPIRGDDEMVGRVLPAIVQIGTADGDTNISTVGTGVIIDSAGYILTAKHNVSGIQHVFVRRMDGIVYKVLYYIADAHRDLALIRVAESDLPTIEIGDSNSLRAGQQVWTFGFPASRIIRGTETVASVSSGVVSAVERELQEHRPSVSEEEAETNDVRLEWGAFRGLEIVPDDTNNVSIRHLFQIDAMMNPGSSGGAVTDSSGKLVGICHSIISNTGGNVGINFAIGISEADMLLQIAGIWTGGKTDGSAENGATTETSE